MTLTLTKDMGLLHNMIRSGIGLAGKTLMRAADGMSGGIASRLLNRTLDYAKANSDVIGKVAGDVGRRYLSDVVRNKLSSAATNAIEYLPSGKVKDTLKRINEATQNKPLKLSMKRHRRLPLY